MESVQPTDEEVVDAETSELSKLATYMASHAAVEEESDTEEAAVLAEVAAARKARRAAESRSGREVASFVMRAEELMRENRFMDAVGAYTDALAIEPNNVNLLAARGGVCARLNLYQATLHDGEMIIQILPDWHQGHALCGMALFCCKQYAPAVRAYRRALDFASKEQGADGLREALAQAQGRVDEELRQAVIKEDMPELKRLLFGGAGGGAGGGGGADGEEPKPDSAVNLEARESQHGFTPLVLATAAGRAESVKMLLRAGAQPDARDKFQKTALMWAAASGNEKLAMMLWKGGADVAAQDAIGWDALYAAAHGGHSRLVTVWLAKADVNRSTSDGTTCLMAAAQAGRQEVVRLLLAKGAEPTAVNAKGQRALELARAGKHTLVAELLEPVTPGPPPPPPINATPPQRGSGAHASAGRGR